MAEVYEVEELASGEHLALKLLMQTGGALPRFNREYEAMIRLNHPNIVRVFHYGFHGDLPWLTMELVEGTPVQAYVKRVGRPGTPERNKEVVRVAHDIARALHHIHVRGLVHRDLKSANVLVLPDGRVKLIDFGTARVSDAIEDITRDGEFVGTFAYASPEQLTGKEIDGRADLYSLGVLLFRLATGKRPFDAKELHELARQHVKEKPRPPREITPSIPEELERIILWLLEKKPENRPQDGSVVAQALEDLAGEPLFIPGTLDVDLSSERLVGREDQIADLRSFFDDEEPCAAALVIGLQGSGRHRIMAAVEKDATARGWQVYQTFLRRGQEDLGPLASMLIKVGRSLGPEASDDALEAIREIRAIDGNQRVPIAQRREVLRESGAVLLSEAAKRSTVLVQVRALQNATPVGFDVLVGLREALQEEDAPVMFVADCLQTADDPDSLARKRLPDALRIALPPLPVRNVALLVGSILNRRPPPNSIASAIHDASGGLPTYVEEVVKDLVGKGILHIDGRHANRIEWASKEGLEIAVPEGARQRVIDGLAALPADRRRLLEALSVAGGEGSPAVIAAALDAEDPAELQPALHDLARRGWITYEDEDGQPYVRWRQILAEEVVLDQLHPCRRDVLQRSLIDLLVDEPPFVAQIMLLLEVGRVEEALFRAQDWGHYHLAKNMPVTALEVLDPVVERLKRDRDIDHSDLARIYLLHATCLLMVRPTDTQTGRSLAQAVRLGKLEDDLFKAELHLTKARIQRVIGHYPNYRKNLLDAWELVEHEAPSGVATTVGKEMGWISQVTGRSDEAATWHGRARRVAIQLDDLGLKAHADVGVADWQYSHGLYADSERTAVTAIEAFQDVGDVRGLSHALPVWADSLRQQGRFSEALGVLYQQTPLMRECEAPSFYVRMMLSTAWLEVGLYRLGRAQECVDELGATLRKGEHLDLRLHADLLWGRIMLASDELGEARLKLYDVQRRATAAGLVNIAASARALLGETLWLLGDFKDSMEEFEEAITQLKRAWDLPAAVQACVSRARVMADRIDPEKLFAPVAEHLDTQPAIVARIERDLARVRYSFARNEGQAEAVARAQARQDDLLEHLNDTDTAAMRVHPWTTQLRVAAKKLEGD